MSTEKAAGEGTYLAEDVVGGGDKTGEVEGVWGETARGHGGPRKEIQENSQS